MANLVFNVALGRVNELHNRVDGNDPTNSVLVIALVSTTGVETDATIRDYDSFSTLFAGSTEITAVTNYARLILDDTDIAANAADDTNDLRASDFADQTFPNLGGATNDDVGDLVIGYDSDSTVGTDADIEPLTWHDFVVSTNGGDIVAQLAAAGYFSASSTT